MRLQNVLKLAIRSISRNKMRSFLTMLGIIIGVAAVIALLALGQGARNAIDAQIASLGTNVLMVMPGSFSQGGARLEAGTASQLTEEDVTTIKQDCQSVQYVSPFIRSNAQIKFGNQNWRTSINGVYPEYLSVRDLSLQSGNNISEGDLRGALKVCILGQTVVDNLFGDGTDPVGQTIRIKNLPFRVIGTLVSKGQTGMGQDQDDIILAPFSTVQGKIVGRNNRFIQSILASAPSKSMIESARTEIDQALQSKRREGSGDGVAYTIRTQTDISNAADQTAKTLTILLASIACVSLVVGGIGIMNIMLVSVKERTREIGTRMAVGAREHDIMQQFLIESITLSFGGGVVGTILGIGVSELVSSMQQWPVSIPLWVILLGFGFSAFIGILFGWYPARTAAKLNPIDALRYE